MIDLRRAVEWYEQVLGFGVAAWPPESPNYCHFKSDGGATYGTWKHQVEVLGSTSLSRIPMRFGESQKEDHRVRVVEGVCSTPYGTRKLTIADPDGYELGFVRDA